MNKQMKVIIAYDGSPYADAAIEDLRLAGLPPHSEVKIVSVVNAPVNSVAASESNRFSLALGRVEGFLRMSEVYSREVIEKTEEIVSKEADSLRLRFPEWKIDGMVLEGTPAEELLREADKWKADLIIVGSRGRSAISRLFLGSISKQIAEEANSNVRIVRREFGKWNDEPIKIIGAASSLHKAERVIESIGRRVWPNGTKVRLVITDDAVSPDRISVVYPYTKEIIEQLAELLAVGGLEVSVEIKNGQAKTTLLETAENWEADSIFIVSGSAYNASGLDKTTAGLITDAQCSVEVVRSPLRL